MSGAKSWDLKPRTFVLWTPHKEHTESAIRKYHLAPCRFKCWTNQISIGISQPLAQLKRRYNVEIPRVSLPDDRLKWDFRTDRDRVAESDSDHDHRRRLPTPGAHHSVYSIGKIVFRGWELSPESWAIGPRPAAARTGTTWHQLKKKSVNFF